MPQRATIQNLEAEWSKPDGFFWMLREWQFHQDAFHRLLKTIQNIHIPEESADIDRDLVRLLWFSPTFLSWQQERVAAEGSDSATLDEAISRLVEALYGVLGVP
jgi:hypothetical protein